MTYSLSLLVLGLWSCSATHSATTSPEPPNGTAGTESDAPRAPIAERSTGFGESWLSADPAAANALGSGWYCVQARLAAEDANYASVCKRRRDECESLGRKLAATYEVGPCVHQAQAHCVIYRFRETGEMNAACSDSRVQCLRKRHQPLSSPQRYEYVSRCEAVR